MTPLINFTQYQAEALVICLGASIVWAGILYFGARAFGKTGPAAESLWIGALILAVMPSLIAPALAAFGVSLRPAPEFVAAPIYYPVETIAPTMAAPVAEIAAAPVLTGEQIISAAAIIYIYGALLALGIWLVQLAGFTFAVSRATPVRDGALLREVELWATRLRVARAPEIRRSHHVSSVCIFGTVRPVIIIPDDIEMKMTRTDIVMMCAHELAHVRRGDTRLFTATALTRVLFWFNPLVKRIAAHAELAAEEGADALVLRAGIDRRAYATCFVEGLKFAAAKLNAQPALTPSFTPADRSGRRRRLDAILAGGAVPAAKMSTKLVLASAASAAALLAVGQAALAVNPESASDRKSASDDLDLTLDDLNLDLDDLDLTLDSLGDSGSTDAASTITVVAEADAPALAVTPVDGKITSKFGVVRMIDGKESPKHSGIDIGAPKGAPVAAAGDGVVLDATSRYNNKPAWGNVVVIDHGHGVVTRYTHLDSYAVKRGDRVNAGDIIGAVGETGRATGPHLHFETLRYGEAVDPVVAIAGEPPAAPVAPIAAAPAPKSAPRPAPAINPAPKPAADPAADVAPLVAPEPAPAAPVKPVGKMKFAMAGGALPGAITINGVTIAAPAAPALFVGGQMFTDETFSQEMLDGVEDSLLGAGDQSMSYNLSFNDGEQTFTISSDDDMTPAEKAKLQKKLKKMRKELARARDEREAHLEEMRADLERNLEDRERAREAREATLERARESAERDRQRAELDREQAERRNDDAAMRRAEAASRRAQAAARRAEAAMRREEARLRREEEQHARVMAHADKDAAHARNDRKFDVVWASADGDHTFDWSGDFTLQILDAQESAIAEARAGLDEVIDDAIESALDDLDDAEADLDDQDLTPAERTEAKRALREARQSLKARGDHHQRAIAEAHRSLDAQQAEIDRQRKELLRKSDAKSKD